MAKRSTDTTKWANPSFRKLDWPYKLLYLYLLDSCDCAGVMHLDLDLIGYSLGFKYNLLLVKNALENKIIFLSEEKIIIRNFIGFQYGDIIASHSSMAKTIRSYLNTHGLLERYLQGEFGAVNKSVKIFDV